MNFKLIYERIIESLRFSARLRRIGKYRNPEDRQFFEDFMYKKKNIVENNLSEEINKIENIKNSYEYKVYEHFKKNEFLSSKKYSSDFLKYCKFDIFYNKKKWTNSIFFVRPYHTPKDFQWTILNKIFLILSIIIFFKVGYSFGFKDSMLYDEIKENLTDIRTEDELFHILKEKKIPILALYYNPGDIFSLDMQFAMGKFIEKYGENYVQMAKINCKYNLDLCIKKSQYLILPQWELMLPGFVNIKFLFFQEDKDENNQVLKKYPIVQCKKDRSYEGLVGFFIEQDIITDKFNPIIMMDNAFKRREL